MMIENNDELCQMKNGSKNKIMSKIKNISSSSMNCVTK